MRYGKWLIAAATGASLTVLCAGGMAQTRPESKAAVPKASVKAKATDEVPRGAGLAVDPDADAPRTKGIGVGRDADDAAARAAAAERRETRRIPAIDATAGSTFRSGQLIGTTITDADGRSIGKVVDFVSDARGNILYQIVSYSGSPGFTGKLFAVPPSGLSFSAGENNSTTAQFAFDPTLLKNAPSFSSLRFPDFSDQAFVNELNAFYSDLLANAGSRETATDPTVPANGPGDRVQTRAQANTPTRPVDPTIPANGPGDRPATVNPALPRTGTPPAATPDSRIPGTTGTENAGFPPPAGASSATPGTTTAGSRIPGTTGTENAGFPASGSAATPTTGTPPGTDLSSPITSTRTAAPRDARSVVGRTGSPAGSTLPEGTVVGRTGSPAPETVPGSARAEVGAEAEGEAAASGSGVNTRTMLRSSQMLGMSIQDNQGRDIGKVIDFVGDTRGNNRFAVVSLGSDGRNIVIPFHALNFQAGAKGSSFATLRVAPGELKNAPSFTGNQWPNFTDAKFVNQVSDFYSDMLPAPGTSRGYDYGRFPTTSPDGTKFPREAAPRTGTVPGAAAPGTAAPGATAPGPRPDASLPAPGTSRGYDYGRFPTPSPDGTKFPRGGSPRKGAGPRLPASGSGAPGVPGVPSLPGGSRPGGPGAAPGTPAPGGGAPGTGGGAAPRSSGS
jgi:sporulation protein YlmC with PRC-barrel domain